ncbi:MAG: hypothetical protein O3A66_02650, partial [Proteobacteria bacterium]|nr:hypothetical protein [Pseudomonadota bacterium]
TNESVKVNGTQRVSTKKGIFFDTITSGHGNNNKFTGNVTTSHKINQNGKNHITAIHKRGKFPFILNLGGGHFISLVLHKKPSKGFERNATWQVAIANSSSPNANNNIYNSHKEVLDSFNKSQFFKDYFGKVDAKNAKYQPCVGQTYANCLLNTYINCRNSQVDENGNVAFPGIGNHPMSAKDVTKEVAELRGRANAYGEYKYENGAWHGAGASGVFPQGGKTNPKLQTTRDKITKEYEKFENKRKFGRVLDRLNKINKEKWNLTAGEVKSIFDDATKGKGGKKGYARLSLPNADDPKRKEKRAFSVAFQKICAEEGLFSLNASAKNKDVGMRTKWANQFMGINGIDAGKSLG